MYSPTVTKPLQSATRNSNVRLARCRGSFWRTGWWTIFSTSTMRSMISVAAPTTGSAAPSFFAMASGCATLQLSR